MARPKTLGNVQPAHVAQRLRRLVFTSDATIDRDGHGYLAVTCSPPHRTFDGMPTVEVTVRDTGDPDQAPRMFLITVTAVDPDEVDDSGLPDGTCTCGHDDCGAC